MMHSMCIFRIALKNPGEERTSILKLPAGLEMGRVKSAFSCDWQEVNHAFRSVFSCFYVVHEGQFYCDFEFHWDLLYIVDMSECEKGSFWEVSVPKTSAVAIFPVISTSSLSTHLFSPTRLFQLHLPPIATAMCERTSKWGHSILVRFLDKMSTDRSITYVRTCKWTCRGVTSWECASTWTLLPHPTPPHPCVTWHIFNVAWRMCARASERAVA